MNNPSLDPAWIGKTFDDFLFRPHKGITSTRSAIALRSQLTDALALELPIVSSNMDSVTGGDICLLYTSPSPRDATLSRMPSSA